MRYREFESYGCVQTGLIALLAFVFGDYMSQLYRLDAYSTSIYAAIANAVFNATGKRLRDLPLTPDKLI